MTAVRTVLVVHLVRAWRGFHRRPMLESLREALPDGFALVLVDRPVTFDVTLLRAPREFAAGIGRTSVQRLDARTWLVRPWMALHEVVAERVPGATAINRRLVRPQLESFLRSGFPDSPRVVDWIYHPIQRWAIGEGGLVYECYDEYSRTPRGEPARWDPAAERSVLARADVTFVTSEALADARGPHARRLRRLTNGIPDRFWQADPGRPDPIDDVPRPRIGCVGAVRSLLEFEMLEALFARRRDWSLVFVGAMHRSARVDGLRRLPNVHILGARDPAVLAGVISRLDVGLVPIESNAFTRASSPMRLGEYAACGVPVVSTELPECRRLGPDVRLAPANADDFEREIAAALAEPRDAAAARLRAQAEELRWSRVVRRDVLPALDEAFGS